MARTLGLGIVGCGNVSTTYFSLAPLLRGIEVRACADLVPAAAAASAKQYGVRADTVDGLLAADDVDIVVNLTIPAAHHEVSRRAIDAGKHVYSEKPFVLSIKHGLDLQKRAARRGLRIGSAPVTFLVGAHQLARHLVDSGKLGKITGGTCFVMSHGMEDWHPIADYRALAKTQRISFAPPLTRTVRISIEPNVPGPPKREGSVSKFWKRLTGRK